MKKGFTLIEIIVSIGIVLVVGITFATILFKVGKNNIEDVTNKILEAANSYVKIEKDSNANIYANEIVSGAKGVKIPLSNLVAKGYVDEKLQNEVIEYGKQVGLNLENDLDYYVMFVEDSDYCEENQIMGISSWMEKGKNVYLCNDYDQNVYDEKSFIDTLINAYTSDSKKLKSIYYILPSHFKRMESYGLLFNNATDYKIFFYTPEDHGLIKDYFDNTYYYRGNVENNYVYICGTLFRIVSFGENSMKLITESGITANYYNDAVSKIENGINNVENWKEFDAIRLWYDDFLANIKGSYDLCDVSYPGFTDTNINAMFELNEDKLYEEGSSYFVTTYKNLPFIINQSYRYDIPMFNDNDLTLELYKTDSSRYYYGKNYGLLNFEEATEAGMYFLLYAQYDNLSTSDSYLISGSSFRISDLSYKKENNTDVYGFNSIYAYDGCCNAGDDSLSVYNSQYAGVYGKTKEITANIYDDYYFDENVITNIRPVIIINPKNVLFSGRGTITEPYNVHPKINTE